MDVHVRPLGFIIDSFELKSVVVIVKGHIEKNGEKVSVCEEEFH